MTNCHIASVTTQFPQRDHYSFTLIYSHDDNHYFNCYFLHTRHTRVSDLHDLFDLRLVGADLGALQPADVLTDPGDESELGSFAHSVSRHDPDEAEQTSVI